MLLRKILFGLSAFVLGISGAVSAQQKDASLLFHYRFDRDRNVELKGNAGLVDGVRALMGKAVMQWCRTAGECISRKGE